MDALLSGEALLYLERTEEAYLAFQVLADDASAHRELRAAAAAWQGVIDVERIDIDAALAVCARSLDIEPHQSFAHLVSGNAHAAAVDPKAARDCWRRVPDRIDGMPPREAIPDYYSLPAQKAYRKGQATLQLGDVAEARRGFDAGMVLRGLTPWQCPRPGRDRHR